PFSKLVKRDWPARTVLRPRARGIVASRPHGQLDLSCRAIELDDAVAGRPVHQPIRFFVDLLWIEDRVDRHLVAEAIQKLARVARTVRLGIMARTGRIPPARKDVRH